MPAPGSPAVSWRARRLAEHQLTGNTTYHGFTPSDTRTAGHRHHERRLVRQPLSGHRADRRRLRSPKRLAQRRSRSTRGKYLANVPFERVLELAPVDQLGIKLPTRPGMMVSFLDFRKISRRRIVGADQLTASTATTCRTVGSTCGSTGTPDAPP